MTADASEPARKRYYLVQQNLADNSSGYSFANKEAALVDGRLAGTHEHQVPGSPHPVLVGIPLLRETPRLIVLGGERNVRDYYGAHPVFVSTRAKALLEGIDPDGFEFVECETVTRRGEPIEPYWWMDVIRWVEKFDEARSHFEWTRDRFPGIPEPEKNLSMFRLYDIHMPAGFPEAYHAFWLAHYHGYAAFDEVLVDAWRAAGLTGAVFTPLQPPTPADLKDQHLFLNAPYWTANARQP